MITKTKKGFFLIEALLAMSIMTMVVLALFSMISFLQTRTLRSSFESSAASLMQEGMEIAHSAVLSDWQGYPSGEYSPVFDANSSVWTLAPGSETGLEARFSRSVTISSVCRNPANGTQIPCPASGVVTPTSDPNSKKVSTKIWWTENGEEKNLEASLLIFKIPDR